MCFKLCFTYSSSPDSMNTDRNDKNSSGLSTAMYKLIVPLLRCEVADIRDAAVNALGLINPDALKYVLLLFHLYNKVNEIVLLCTQRFNGGTCAVYKGSSGQEARKYEETSTTRCIEIATRESFEIDC